MKKKSCLALALGGVVLGCVMLGASLLLDAIPKGVTGLLCGLGGAVLGVSGSALIMELASRRMGPEEQKELERSEKDERNIIIREKAAQDSWYWSLALLWIPFMVALMEGGTLYIALSSCVIVLHCLFYLINIGRWNKKM